MKNQGITLVALVVTVIILLIIAGVAVSMITGNDGLFTKANEAGTLYNEEARKEAEWLQQLMDSEYLGGNGTGGNGSGSGVTTTIPTVTGPLSNGSFDNTKKVNSPDVSKLPTTSTKYVIWTGNGAYDKQVLYAEPQNWYNYNNGQWANIVTAANGLEAYWVWIPRFAYKLPEVGNGNEKEIEVIFVKNDSKTGVLADGTEVQCYYSTDTEITTDGSGLYNSKTADAASKWIIHPAFWWDNNSNMVRDAGEEINGFWVAKFEPSNNGEKVEIRDNVSTWRNINLKTIFEVTRAMQNTGGVIGTTTGTTTIDSHLAKNMEWGAVSILTHSKFGIYNPSSAVKNETKPRVWNNPNSGNITGSVSKTAYTSSNDSATRDVANLTDATCDKYNIGNGPKASSTGTVYGVYDLAGGSFEYVMGVVATDDNISSIAPSISVDNSGYTDTTDFTNNIARKYYNAYKTGAWTVYTGRGYIGDMTEELKPIDGSKSAGVLWYDDSANFIQVSYGFFHRGGNYSNAASAGATAFRNTSGAAHNDISFRPILLMP